MGWIYLHKSFTITLRLNREKIQRHSTVDEVFSWRHDNGSWFLPN